MEGNAKLKRDHDLCVRSAHEPRRAFEARPLVRALRNRTACVAYFFSESARGACKFGTRKAKKKHKKGAGEEERQNSLELEVALSSVNPSRSKVTLLQRRATRLLRRSSTEVAGGQALSPFRVRDSE